LVQQIVLIIEAYYFVSYVQNFNKHSAVKVNSKCRGNY